MKKLPPNDTSPEAEAVLIDCLRRMSPAEKWRRLEDMYRQGRALHAAGVRMRLPNATDAEINEDWLLLTVGKEQIEAIKEARRGLEP